jgi:hypothetical protein
MTIKKISALIDRIEKHSNAAVDEHVYSMSLQSGTTRSDQARARGHKAEQARDKAIAELRAALAVSTGHGGSADR